MNAQTVIEHESIVKITSKGQVFLSKAIRQKGGIAPGASVGISANENGEIILRKIADSIETPDERSARVKAALEALRGKYKTGRSTDEIMREIRGDWEP